MMDIFLVYSLPLPTFVLHHQRCHYPLPTNTSTSISFSLKPPPPPQPPPPSSEPNDPSPTSLRRPSKSSNSSSSSPSPAPKSKTLYNPFRNLSKPSFIPPSPSHSTATTSINASHSLSSKLWLSSKLSPPPPPPPTTQDEEIPIEKTPSQEKEIQNLRQEGKIFVGNLPNWIKKHEVAEFFRQFGPIKNVILIRGHNDTERNAGFGFVIYGGPVAERSAMKAVEFDGMEFHGRLLTVKLDDGRRLKEKAEERARWVEGHDGEEAYRSKWHQEREGSRKVFRKVLETEPENWQAVVTAFERINKSYSRLCSW